MKSQRRQYLTKTAFMNGATALALIWTVGCASAPTTVAEAVGEGLIIDRVTVVNTQNGTLAADRAVLVQGGKIVKIAAASSFRATGTARRIDAQGDYVVPGYLDMHAHMLDAAASDAAKALMIANGVTGYRQMSGNPALLAQRSRGDLASTDAAPELLVMPGLIMTGGTAPSPEAGVAQVRAQKAQGADFIKVVDLSPATFDAVLAEATALNLPVAGHLQDTIEERVAARNGMRAIEHLGPKASVLLGCSTDEAELRQQIAAEPPHPPRVGIPGSDPVASAAILRAVSNPILVTDPRELAIMGRIMATYDEGRCRDLAQVFVAAGTWHVPTLIRVRTMQIADDPAYANDPNLRYAPAASRALWTELAVAFDQQLSSDTRTMLRRYYDLQLQTVKLFDTMGVRMLAGSDFGGQWEIAGMSLHQEFDQLSAAGLSPLTVLQMTTLNGAQFLGRESTMGSVDEGKDANLVLLSADPTADVQALHQIVGVVRAGRYYDASDLAALKQSATGR